MYGLYQPDYYKVKYSIGHGQTQGLSTGDANKVLQVGAVTIPTSKRLDLPLPVPYRRLPFHRMWDDCSENTS